MPLEKRLRLRISRDDADIAEPAGERLRNGSAAKTPLL